MKTITPQDFTRVRNDVNGNPRYVCHYLNLNSQAESDIQLEWDANGRITIDKYAMALNRAKKAGGRKFHNKQYGGGIVFQSYSLPALCSHLNELLNEEVTA
jgi:hypothetical protein